MGREIRRVPPNWEHPKREQYKYNPDSEVRYKPLYDKSCEEAWNEWQREYQEWLDGEHDKIRSKYGDDKYPKDQPYTSFCKWHGNSPEPEYCRPQWGEGEATWWQVYETVSEGTPVTPPFATKEELIDYLVANGDFWDQSRRKEGNSTMNCDPWSREQSEKFVNGPGWAPSFVSDSKGFRSGVEALADID